MFKLDDREKKGKASVLQEIMDLMDQKSGSKLKDLKKPAAVEVSSLELDPEERRDEEEGDENPFGNLEKDDEDEPSDDEKAQIAALYHKYCK